MAENLSDTTKRIARTVLFLTGLLSTFFMAFAYMKFVWKYPCALIVSGLPGYILFISMIIIMSILALILYEMFFNKNPNGTRKALLSRKTNRLVWALLLLVIVIGFVLPIGLTFSVFSHTQSELEAKKTECIKAYNETDPEAEVTFAFDAYQSSYQCCGVESADDWKLNEQYGEKTDQGPRALPWTCCQHSNSSLSEPCLSNSTNLNAVGCRIKFILSYKYLGFFYIVLLVVLSADLLRAKRSGRPAESNKTPAIYPAIELLRSP